MTVHVTRSDDPVAMAGQRLAARLRDVLAGRDHARLAVAGGSALAALPPALASLGADRARVRMTWVDERCVPVADPDSNRGSAYGALGEHRPGLELPLWLDGESVEEALTRVRVGLTRDFDDGLDVTLLGMGGDGHIASLFVGDFAEGDRVTYIPDSPKPPPRRLTLTRPFLATAGAHVLLATGAGKRDALLRLLEGDAALPATGLDDLELVTDLDLETT